MAANSKTTYKLNGVEYTSLDELPPEYKKYFVDTDKDGIPDIVTKKTTTVRSTRSPGKSQSPNQVYSSQLAGSFDTQSSNGYDEVEAIQTTTTNSPPLRMQISLPGTKIKADAWWLAVGLFAVLIVLIELLT